ncbi:DUF4013 domain-containing protein [Halegenticoccus soli]|uniref:DUF4013 domain-containing protein n=1 Tax=Halegenticoccus soli TaxID=1985678 RepID=UPI0013042D1C|nr:DUF4013 domain-containing protein [Halegenticoccus soli]
MLTDALKTPARTDDAASTVLIGGALALVSTVGPPLFVVGLASTPLALAFAPFVALPPLVLRGYHVRVIRGGLDGDPAAPSFVRWGGLVVDGAKSLLLSVGYLLPVAVAAGIVAAAASAVDAGGVDFGPVGAPLVSVGVTVVGLFGVVYGLAFLYVRPAALALFAASGRLRDAFSPRRVLRVCRSGDYVTGWLVGIGVLAVGLAVAVPLQLVLVGFAVAFYVEVAAHSAYGRGAASALGRDSRGAIGTGGVDAGGIDGDGIPADGIGADRIGGDGMEGAADSRVPSEAPPSVQTGRTVGSPAVSANRRGGTATNGRQTGTAADGFVWDDAEDPDE